MVHRGKRSGKGEEKQRMWEEAFYDRTIAEVVARLTYPLLDVRRGEVIKQGLGYMHPSLAQSQLST